MQPKCRRQATRLIDQLLRSHSLNISRLIALPA